MISRGKRYPRYLGEWLVIGLLCQLRPQLDSALAAARLTGATRHGALKFRDTIAAAMTSEQIAEAHRLAQEWTPTSER